MSWEPIGFKSFSSLNHGNKLNKKNHQPCQGARGARHPDVVLVAGYHQPVRIGAHKEPYGVRLSTLSTSPRFYRQFPRIWVSQHRWWNPFMCWTIDASWSDMISSLMWVINCSKLMYLPPFFPTWWSQVGWTNRLLARETATTTPAMLAFRTWMLFAENGRDISKKTMTFQIWRGTKYKKKTAWCGNPSNGFWCFSSLCSRDWTMDVPFFWLLWIHKLVRLSWPVSPTCSGPSITTKLG